MENENENRETIEQEIEAQSLEVLRNMLHADITETGWIDLIDFAENQGNK